MVGIANAAVTNLFPNGNFDSPAGTSTPWVEVFGGGTTTYSYPTSGGNPGGYGVMNNSSGWGIWVGGAATPLSLASLGIVAGGSYTFVMDMKNISGTGIGKLKIESWAGGVLLSDTGDISAGSQSGSWATYSFPVTLHAAATGIKVVPVAGAASQIGYDNLGVIVTSSPLAVSITSPANSAVVISNFSIEATATVSPGTVTNVAFYDGTTLLGNDTTSSYSFAVTGSASGAHTLKAVARDSAGNSATSSVVSITVSNPPPIVGWQLVWNDEFSQANGSSPDSSKWGYDIGGGGYGNNELESYTSRTNNARIEGGQLVIEARQENYTGPDSIPRNYTSARMLTRGKWSWTYGRIEARIKIPKGQGIWPAFWMLGTNIDAGVNWPNCGEIDIMENIGKTTEQAKVYGTIHGPQSGGDYNGGAGVGGSYTLPLGVFADDYHVFAVEWTTNQIKWYVDTNLYFTATPASLPSGGTWVFTNAQYLILNVAVGGNWPGNPDGTTVFPQQMLVDYVRVYSPVTVPPTAPAAPTGLTVSPGSTTVYLNWNASSGATSYNVKRATVSGGPYTTVASLTANNYTDTGVANCSAYYYVVSATNSAGASTNSSEQAAVLGAFALAVKPGGSPAGQFVLDAAYVAGGTIGAVASATIDTSGLVAPAPQAVYQSERYGNFTYTFPGLISGVSYKVRLHFAETYWTAAGQRRFNVTINGTQVLTNFDIIAVAGAANKAVVNEFNAVASGGQIVVQYTTVTDNARANGIEILLSQPPAPVGLTATATNSQVSLKWNSIAGTTYNVKRALSNVGTFTPIFSGLTSTNCIDSTTTNALTNYYVVSSVMLGCESTNSASVSAPGAALVLPVKMRGISTSDKYLKADLFALLAQTDVNVIRLGFSVDSTNPPTAQNSLAPYTTNLATLDAALPLARAAGIKIILCAAETYGWSPNVFRGSAADLATYRTNLMTFWTAMAQRYANEPAIVAYDILNEPATDYFSQGAWYTNVMPAAVAAIRQVNSNIWLVIESEYQGAAGGFSTMPVLNDSKVIYSFHFYSPHSYCNQGILGYAGYTATYPGSNSMWGTAPYTFWDKETLRTEMLEAIGFSRANPNKRILVGEFGVVRWAAGADKWLGDSIELFEEYGWDWCNHSPAGWNGYNATYSPTNQSVSAAPDGGDRGARWTVLHQWFSFNQLDSYGIPTGWKTRYFGATNAVNGGALDDWDHDGMNNWQEYLAGTIPTNASSKFQVTDFKAQSGTNIVIQWSSVAGKKYTLKTTTNLLAGFNGWATNHILATPPLNTHTVTLDQFQSRLYRVTVEP